MGPGRAAADHHRYAGAGSRLKSGARAATEEKKWQKKTAKTEFIGEVLNRRCCRVEGGGAEPEIHWPCGCALIGRRPPLFYVERKLPPTVHHQKRIEPGMGGLIEIFEKHPPRYQRPATGLCTTKRNSMRQKPKYRLLGGAAGLGRTEGVALGKGNSAGD